jgi:hypothetical protein
LPLREEGEEKKFSVPLTSYLVLGIRLIIVILRAGLFQKKKRKIKYEI